MNIDGYLHRIHTGIGKLEDLIHKAKDIIDNRVEKTTKAIATTLFIDLSEARAYSLSEFVSEHERHIKSIAYQLDAKNLEVEQSVYDMVDVVRTHCVELNIVPDVNAEEAIIDYYERMMFQAILRATALSLHSLKKRMGSQRAHSILAEEHTPLFNVDVELMIPEVAMNPTLEDIQAAINRAAIAIVHASKHMLIWRQNRGTHTSTSIHHSAAHQLQHAGTASSTGTPPGAGGATGSVSGAGSASSPLPVGNNNKSATSSSGQGLQQQQQQPNDKQQQQQQQQPNDKQQQSPQRAGDFVSQSGGIVVPVEKTFFHRVAKQKSIVCDVLLLTGGVEGIKLRVRNYLYTYTKYDYLWQDDKQLEYQAFLSQRPVLEDYERQMKRYMLVEASIAAIEPTHTIGALNLASQSLKYSLKAEAAAWKAQYAKNLHTEAKAKLDVVRASTAELSLKLDDPIGDITQLQAMIELLALVRDRDAEIEAELVPVEDMYALLLRYEVRVPKEEVNQVQEMRANWKAVCTKGDAVSQALSKIQIDFKKDLVRDIKTFAVDVIQFRNDFDANGPGVPKITPQMAVERLKKFRKMCDERERKAAYYKGGEQLFGLALTEYPDLERTRRELVQLGKLYDLYVEVIASINDLRDSLWVHLKAGAVVEKFEAFQNTCKVKLSKSLRDLDAYRELKKMLDETEATLPVLVALSSRAIRSRHWSQVMQATGKSFRLDSDTFRVRHLLEAGVMLHREEVIEITVAAARELDIEARLKQIEEEWSDQTFAFAEFRNRGLVTLKGPVTQNILNSLEESQTILGTIKTSRYVAAFKAEVTSWLSKFSSVSEVVELWLDVQNTWVHLESVFTSKDIIVKLPREAKRFSQVDKNWCKIMQKAVDNPNVISLCCSSDLVQNMLKHLHDQLEICQKALAGHLEIKRSEFPRFAFVSDSVLLDILSQPDPASIQPHLRSLFANIDSLAFEPSGPKKDKFHITSMISKERERVEFVEPVVMDSPVEVWLGAVEAEMQRSVKAYVQKVAEDCLVLPVVDFVKKFPAQIGLLGLQFLWTRDCQEALGRSKGEKSLVASTSKKVSSNLASLVQLAQSDLSPLLRTKIETIITTAVNQRDVWEHLVAMRVSTVSDFEWQRHARFHWNNIDGHCVVSIGDVDMLYCNEYLGSLERLVITPLTDRCYVAMTQALSMILGGSPVGPAGTGKTETVKDLGRSLGKYVIVQNCNDQLDFRGLGRFLKGLVQSGTWGCFDEFNRLSLQVLSVAAQQIASIFTAQREKKSPFTFTDATQVRVNPGCGIFITMNPGYAGRQELPENLKSLFRGVTMIVPDNEIIIKVKLASQGFQEAADLAAKFTCLYAVAEHQCSRQHHYDWGLRNILSVLRTTGAVRRANLATAESFILASQLASINVPKLVAADVPVFTDLLQSMFPAAPMSASDELGLDTAIAEQLARAGLVVHQPLIDKMLELHHSSTTRHGLMVVGPAGAGKSTCIDILLKSLTQLGSQHVLKKINPKAVSTSQLFGRIDVKTGDWVEGVLPALWRKALKAKAKTWICLDGSVDPVWIEDLNSVLDDSKILTLANGDRLPLSDNLRLVFETEDLSNASPATVSRAGMVYISESTLGWQPLVANWISSRPADQAHRLRPVMDSFIPALSAMIEHVTTEATPAYPVNAPTMIRSFLAYFESLLDEALETHDSLITDSEGGTGVSLDADEELQQQQLLQQQQQQQQQLLQQQQNAADAKDKDKKAGSGKGKGKTGSGTSSAKKPVASVPKKKVPEKKIEFQGKIVTDATDLFIQRMLTFSAVWSIGGVLGPLDHPHFDRIVRGLVNVAPGATSNGKLSVFDFYVDMSTMGWISWEDIAASTSAGVGGVNNGPSSSSVPDVNPGLARTGGGVGKAQQLSRQQAGSGAGGGASVGNSGSSNAPGSLSRGESQPGMLRGSPGGVRASGESSHPFPPAKFVTTPDTVRVLTLMDLLRKRKLPMLLVGEPGVGKSTLVEGFLSSAPVSAELRAANVSQLVKTVALSSATLPAQLQSSILGIVEKVQGRMFGPPPGRALTILLDDVSSPRFGPWGDQAASELLRQLLEEGGFYSLARAGDWISVVDVSFIATVNLPGGGTNDLPARLKRHLIPIMVQVPSLPSLETIFKGVLENHFGRHGLRPLANKLIPITHDLWSACRDSLLPVVGKAHYRFTLRDLFRVFAGMRASDPETIGPSDVDLMRLWKHEAFRALGDKLSTPQDLKWFSNYVMQLMSSFAAENTISGIDFEEQPRFADFFLEEDDGFGSAGMAGDFGIGSANASGGANGGGFHHSNGPDDGVGGDDFQSHHLLHQPAIVVSTGGNGGGGNNSSGKNAAKRVKPYVLASSAPILHTRVESYIEQYNALHQGSEISGIVLFPEWVDHLVRVARVLRAPRGHVLLPGVIGSGRQTIVRLASYMAGYVTYSVSVHNAYDVNMFLEDIRTVFRQCGLQNKETVFLLTERDLVSEQFLEIINTFLRSGDIPGLFTRDEMDSIGNDLRPIAKERFGSSFVDSQESLASFFRERVLSNLHLALVLSSAPSSFEPRLLLYPGLLSSCTLDYFQSWSSEALLALGKAQLSDYGEVSLEPQLAGELFKHFAEVHSIVERAAASYAAANRRPVHVTARHFTWLIENFAQLYQGKFKSLNEAASNVRIGLTKLDKAGADVNDLSHQLGAKEASLAKAQAEYDNKLVSITQSTVRAEKKKSQVLTVKNELAANTEYIAREKEEAERDLAAAKPALEAALQALKAIKPSDISMLKSMMNPPDLIKRIFDCVLILFHRPLEPVEMIEANKRAVIKTSYAVSQKLMADANFIGSLMSFPKENVNAETIELMQPYISSPDFNVASAKKSSGNVGGLAQWVLAMAVYFDISREVRPKIDALREAESRLQTAQAQLSEAERDLLLQTEEVERMQTEFDQAQARKQEVLMDAQKTRDRIDKARSLLLALSDERSRWESQSLDEVLARLPGDVGQAAAFITYLGPFPGELRRSLLTQIRANAAEHSLRISPDLAIVPFLADEPTRGRFVMEGLPADDYSIENGVILVQNHRYSLLIDPEGQAVDWLLRREQGNRVVACSQQDKSFRALLTDALLLGQPFVLLNVEDTLDSMVRAILDNKIMLSGRSLKLLTSEGPVDFHENFRMYLATRRSNPGLSQDVLSRLLLVDFSVTSKGLEAQLLTRVIAREKAMLEEQRQAVMRDITENEEKMASLEKTLLDHLTAAKGDLLEDSALLELLSNTKVTAKEVSAALSTAARNNESITSAMEEYRPVAVRGAVLYQVAQDMARINHMYNLPMDSFVKLVETGIRLAERAPLAHRRVANIISSITWVFYSYVSVGYFDQDKVMFRLLLTLHVELAAGTVHQEEFLYLMRGGALQDSNQVSPKAASLSWMTEQTYLSLCELASLGRLPDLVSLVTKNDSQWKNWAESECPETADLPSVLRDSGASVNTLTRLLLVRAFRTDRFVIAAQALVSEVLGKRFTTSAPLDFRAIVDETDSRTSLVLLLSAGADPASYIEAAARKANRGEVQWLSLALGQRDRTLRRLEDASVQGGWVVLANAHLAQDFMPRIADFLEAAASTQPVHADFRLFITSHPVPDFSPRVLSHSRQVTFDVPRGIRQALRDTFATVATPAVFEHRSRQDYRSLVFGLAFLHAVVIERAKFGPMGWSVPYEFNASDLRASLHFVSSHLADPSAQVSWAALKYMVAEVQYGGKIIDTFDRRLFGAYFDMWFTPAMFDRGAVFADGYPIITVSDPSRLDSFVEDLPAIDPPRVFGLHLNADRKCRAQEAEGIFAGLLTASGPNLLAAAAAAAASSGSMQDPVTGRSSVYPHSDADTSTGGAPAGVGGGGGGPGGKGPTKAAGLLSGGGGNAVGPVSRKSHTTTPNHVDFGSASSSSSNATLAMIADIAEKLPKTLRVDQAEAKVEKLGGMTIPLLIFLFKEYTQLQHVIGVITQALISLRKAIDGEVSFSSELTALLTTLRSGGVPKSWINASCGDVRWSPPLGMFVTHLQERADQIYSWLNVGKPQYLWFPGFFHPRGFLAALRQQECRARSLPLDGVTLSTNVLSYYGKGDDLVKKDKKGKEGSGDGEGILIQGLLLEGASWSREQGRIIPSDSNVLSVPLPVIHLSYIRTVVNTGDSGDPGAVPAFDAIPTHYDCPVYSSRLRADANYIFSLKVKSDDPRKNILSGAAALTTIF